MSYELPEIVSCEKSGNQTIFYVIVAQKNPSRRVEKTNFLTIKRVLHISKAKSSERNDGCKVKVRCDM